MSLYFQIESLEIETVYIDLKHGVDHHEEKNIYTAFSRKLPYVEY